jgi:hypothetical protein
MFERFTDDARKASSATTRSPNALYDSVGYVEMARQMAKDLDA